MPPSMSSALTGARPWRGARMGARARVGAPSEDEQQKIFSDIDSAPAAAGNDYVKSVDAVHSYANWRKEAMVDAEREARDAELRAESAEEAKLQERKKKEEAKKKAQELEESLVAEADALREMKVADKEFMEELKKHVKALRDSLEIRQANALTFLAVEWLEEGTNVQERNKILGGRGPVKIAIDGDALKLLDASGRDVGMTSEKVEKLIGKAVQAYERIYDIKGVNKPSSTQIYKAPHTQVKASADDGGEEDEDEEGDEEASADDDGDERLARRQNNGEKEATPLDATSLS